MNQEENILQLILEKESWEEVIYHIVSVENLDPWNIDLIKLTSKFIEYIQKVRELDFRIPAKIVFVAVVLLRLKADYLSIFEEEESIEEIAKEKPFIDLGIDPSLIELGVPIKRVPKRQVTLNELINALRKALVVKERREERKIFWKKRIVAQIGEEDIAKRIEHILKEIEKAIQKSKKDKINFRSIVEEWNREKIVEHFIPLLHLEQNKKVRTEQEDWFKEIWISKLED
ncbi:MAG: segregation/condensation protein A [Candidatus Aenigmatarchaeota archaeon]